MRIYLIGFMGCGKSSFGKRLARKLEYPFVDLDADIEHETGQSLDDYFETYGEAQFRRTERQALLRTLSLPKAVIATGGGTPCFEDNMDVMNAEGVSVYLRMSPLSLAHRLQKAQTKRPLLKDLHEKELLPYIREKLNEREAYYLKSHCIIKGETVKTDQVVSLLFG